MSEDNGKTEDFMSAPDYGRSLTGLGINLLVRDVPATLSFLDEVFGLQPLHANKDFAVLTHGDHQWMLHGDQTYHSNPLLGLTGDGAIRGIGIEIRLYDIDPDDAEARALARGDHVLQTSADKPHGLRECFLVDPDGYVWVPSRHLPTEETS